MNPNIPVHFVEFAPTISELEMILKDISMIKSFPTPTYPAEWNSVKDLNIQVQKKEDLSIKYTLWCYESPGTGWKTIEVNPHTPQTPYGKAYSGAHTWDLANGGKRIR